MTNSLMIAYPILAAVYVGLFYILYKLIRRNNAVKKFCDEMNERCYKYSHRHLADDDYNAYEWCMNKLPSYSSMVWSFKPIKMETWLDQEIIDKLNS